MGIGPRLDLRQSQSLVMTPQLQQAIKLLALSNLEIEGFIAEELERNPLLEAASGEDVASAERAAERAIDPAGDDRFDDAASAGEPPEPATADQLIAAGDAAADSPLDVDYAAETFHHDGPTDGIAAQGGPGLDGGLGLNGGAGGGGEDGPGFEAMLAEELTLHDHLLAQAGEVLSGADLVLATLLIDQIDEAGYFTGDLMDVAQRRRMPLAQAERVLGVIQTFDPTGVGARGLAECLALQAKEVDRYDPAMARLLANLPLVAKGALPQLRRLCGVDEEDMADMVRELRNYDPKPGLRYGSSRMQAVVPDLFVARTATGWAIELNSATLPRLLVNRGYHAELAAGAKGSKEGRAWLSEALASANWLVKALDQRARTIMKVATEIVRQQEGFFLHGVAHLKPLTLRQVADAIGMHESTVSRVTSNKYLSCARGFFELKYFFTSGIASSDGGEAASAEAVKSHIKALIAAEGDAILSDDKLVELLQAKGFDIARRTVAKYREAIGLGSSVQRRRARALGRAA